MQVGDGEDTIVSAQQPTSSQPQHDGSEDFLLDGSAVSALSSVGGSECVDDPAAINLGDMFGPVFSSDGCISALDAMEVVTVVFMRGAVVCFPAVSYT